MRSVALVLVMLSSFAAAPVPPQIANERLLNPDVAVYRRSATELWVYDARPEAGVGAHQLDDHSIQMIKAANVRLVRHTMYWGQIENTQAPGKYDPAALKAFDETVARCDRAGLVLLVVVHSNAPGVSYANRKEGYQRFSRFVGDMAERYPTVRFWELWNEMDQAFTDLFGAQDPTTNLRQRGVMYAQMLKLAYPAIKKGNPRAWVLTGGMTDWDEFPRGIYDGGGREYFDFMNLHTYGVPVIYGFVGRGLAIHNVMKEYKDDGRPLWNTEFGIDAGNVVNAWGMPSKRNPPTEDGPDFDEVHLATWRDCLTDNAKRRLFVKALGYQLAAGNETAKEKMPDAKLPAGRTQDDYGFGLLRADGSPRPTHDWLRTANPNVHLATPERTVDIELFIPDGATPIGYEHQYQWRAPWVLIKKVKVNTLEPTVIRLKAK